MKATLGVFLLVSAQAHRLRYDEAEGPTKVDFGDSEPNILAREADINEKSEKQSGWTNPLSWADSGDDDDKILDLHFKPLDQPRKKVVFNYEYDDDVIETMASEKQARAEVKKHEERFKEMEKKELEAERERELALK